MSLLMLETSDELHVMTAQCSESIDGAMTRLPLIGMLHVHHYKNDSP